MERETKLVYWRRAKTRGGRGGGKGESTVDVAGQEGEGKEKHVQKRLRIARMVETKPSQKVTVTYTAAR